MQVSVEVSDVLESERVALQFGMDRFNRANRASVQTFDEFLARFIKLRVIPRFVQEEAQSFRQSVQQRLRKTTITSNDKQQLEAIIEQIETSAAQ